MTALPRPELDTFLLTIQEAVELAEEGKAADGYQALLAGLRRAEEAAGYRLQVQEMDGQRVRKMLIVQSPLPEQPAGTR